MTTAATSRAAEHIKAARAEIKKISDFMHSNPEVAYEERKACAKQVEFLKAQGFRVESPYGGLDTAFKAVHGEGGPVFCIMSEYDALPELGHACGHNLIAASALAAGVALKKAMEEGRVKGRVVVMGTPAEEGLGGKVRLLESGAFKGIDAALISHPFKSTMTDCGWLTVSRFDVSFLGKSAHASVNPDSGVNALDAMNLLFAGIGAWRQQLPEASRVHGVIVSGGNLPNIIPDFTKAYFYIRADSTKVHNQMEQRFEDIVRGAALMTGCGFKIDRLPGPYKNNIYNKPFDEGFFDLATDAGMSPERSERNGRVSSDFANVSHEMPCSNLFFGITGGAPHALHSVEFRDCAGTEAAFDAAMRIASVMAALAERYMTNPAFHDEVHRDFDRRKQEDNA